MKKIILILSVVVIVIIVILASLSLQSKYETISLGNSQTQIKAFELDSNDDAHILTYDINTFKHVEISDGIFNETTLHNGWVEKFSLTIDNHDMPAIAYVPYLHRGNISAEPIFLKYAFLSDNQWKNETVTGEHYWIYNPIIKKHDDSVHIIYMGESYDVSEPYNENTTHTYFLKYATRINTSWTVTTLAQGTSFFYYVSTDISSEGVLHLCYKTIGDNEYLAYGTLTQYSSWKFDIISYHNYTEVINPIIYVDSLGNPKIIFGDYLHNNTKQMIMTDNGSWEINVILDEPVWPYSAQVDSEGILHFCYFTSSAQSYSPEIKLIHVYEDDDKWNSEVIDEGVSITYSSSVMAIDSHDKPHFVYSKHYQNDESPSGYTKMPVYTK